jgi:hypothetical protein
MQSKEVQSILSKLSEKEKKLDSNSAYIDLFVTVDGVLNEEFEVVLSPGQLNVEGNKRDENTNKKN